MQTTTKMIIATLFGAGLLAATPANAKRPDYCALDHDHRSHSSTYYDYYEPDRYSRRGDYRRDDYRSDRRRDYDRRYDRRRYHRPRSKVVFRKTYPTRYDARIVLVEEIYYTRSGRKQLVCSVLAKGYDAYDVPFRRLKRVAKRDCSRRARIQYL